MADAVKDLTTGFGTLSYGGYTFGPLRHVKAKIAPEWDRARRTVTKLKWTLDVHAIIHGDNVGNQEANMNAVHRALTEPRLKLTISGIGLDTSITTDRAGTKPDISWGPKPTLHALAPVGGDLAWEVNWSVEFETPPYCASANISAGEPIAFNYTAAYTTNEEGLVTRVLSGYMEIVQFANGRRPAANPEAAFDRFTFQLPDLFRRVSCSRQFNESKNVVEFQIIDQELSDYPYPDGLVECDVDYDLENRPPGFINWTGQLSGTMRVAPGLPKSIAADKFFIIVFDIADKLNNAAAPSKGVVIPERIGIGTKKFGRSSRFAVTWRMVACLHDILTKTGLWEPVPGTSYQSWRSSMIAAGVFHPRGVGKWRMNSNEDTIIDLCGGASSITLGADTGARYEPAGQPKTRLGCGNITKERSYLMFRNKIRGVQRQNAIIHKIMQVFGGATYSALTGDSGSEAKFPSESTGGKPKDHIVQYQTASDDFIIMTGRALRLKFVPEIPKLTKVAGVDVEELSRNVVTEPITSYFDCPLYEARWAILYKPKGQIYAIKPPKIKELCGTEGEEDGRTK